MKDSMHAEIVATALENACAARSPAPGTIFQSDRGSQFSSSLVRGKLKAFKLAQSMTAVKLCYENSITETFFATLKKELIYRFRFKDRNSARREIFDYVEVFHNRVRIRSRSGVFRRQFCSLRIWMHASGEVVFCCNSPRSGG